MKIPDKIKIGGHDIIVLTTSSSLLEDNGCFFSGSQEIILHEKVSESCQAQTLLHEVVEFINTANDLNMNHTQISTVAEGIFDLLRNNPIDFKDKTDNTPELEKIALEKLSNLMQK